MTRSHYWSPPHQEETWAPSLINVGVGVAEGFPILYSLREAPQCRKHQLGGYTQSLAFACRAPTAVQVPSPSPNMLINSFHALDQYLESKDSQFKEM